MSEKQPLITDTSGDPSYPKPSLPGQFPLQNDEPGKRFERYREIRDIHSDSHFQHGNNQADKFDTAPIMTEDQAAKFAVWDVVGRHISKERAYDLAYSQKEYVELLADRERKSFFGPSKSKVDEARVRYNEAKLDAEIEIRKNHRKEGVDSANTENSILSDHRYETYLMATLAAAEANRLANPEGRTGNFKRKFLQKWADW